MVDEEKENISMTDRANYQIVVKGKLDERWSDWFNGGTHKSELTRQGCSCTVLACKVRDQSELIGILNRLSSLNLPLLEVKWVATE